MAFTVYASDIDVFPQLTATNSWTAALSLNMTRRCIARVAMVASLAPKATAMVWELGFSPWMMAQSIRLASLIHFFILSAFNVLQFKFYAGVDSLGRNLPLNSLV